MSKRLFANLSALSCIAGIVMLIVSFSINPGPPRNATTAADLIRFGHEHFASVLWGAWLQAVAPVLIVLFAFALVVLGRATQHLSGWMTLLGSTILMTVSLIEITFYISALMSDPDVLPFISLKLIYAVQHLYFIIAAPALFVPLGIVIVQTRVLPRVLGYLALVVAAAFAFAGVAFLPTLQLPDAVLAFAGIQPFWWLAAAITLMVRSGKLKDTAI